VLALALAVPVRAAEYEAKSWVLMDGATGTVLEKGNEQEKLAPASVTKVMTLLLIMEAIDSGQIGWGARIDLTYRHDKDYCGIGAVIRDHGVTGFSYLYKDIVEGLPLDKKRLMDPSRKLAVGVTNMLTGETEYMEKGKCNLSAAVRASATVPYVSRPVVIKGIPYLDGGCSTKIPYPYAVREGTDKIVVIKTREWSYRRNTAPNKVAMTMYRKYPKFVQSINRANDDFNKMTDDLYKLHADGKIFVLAPSKPVEVTRFEGDMEKLGELYWLGYEDAKENIEKIKEYLQ
jgi:predicted patatin/cPLA2 family phospholipase